jgi:hypothetical protein
MPDAIRTAPREDRVLCGPAIMFAIAEEINLLLLMIVREMK